MIAIKTPMVETISVRQLTVHLSSNDHLEMGGLISQLLNFKTSCFNIAWSPLGIQGLHATLVEMIPTMDSVI